MKSLLLGFAVPLLALAVWGIAALPHERSAQDAAPRLLLLVVAVPTFCAAASAQLLAVISPRRQFDARMRSGGPQRFAAGVFGGVIATGAIGLLLLIGDRSMPDGLLAAGAGALAGIIAVLPLSRVRPGVCFHCGYDLFAQPGPGQPGFGRCPECGNETVERREITRPLVVTEEPRAPRPGHPGAHAAA